MINDAPCRHLSITCSTRKEVAQHSIGTYCKTINGTSEKDLKQALQGNAKDALQAKIMEVEDTAEEIDSVLAEVSDEVLEGIVAGNIPKPPPYGFDGG